MNLLFVTKDWRHGIEKNTVYLANALKRLIDFTEWNEPGDINDIVRALPRKPDFILLNDLRPTRCQPISGLDRLRLPFGIIMHDLHYRPDERKAFIRDNNIRHLFVHYRSYFMEHYPEFTDRMIWFPHWVDTDVFQDYGQNKSCDFLLMGCTDDYVYPLRSLILSQMEHLPGFVYHPHPGYEINRYSEAEHIVGARYAKEINKAKIFLTDNSIYRNMLIKYFEIPACNTLLLAPDSADARDLGFVPGGNYINIDETDFYEKAVYYAHHFDTVGRKIARRGYEMVRERHSVKQRARQLINKIERILQNGS